MEGHSLRVLTRRLHGSPPDEDERMLRRDVERSTLRKEYLSDVALTTAGLGMIWEQQALQPKLGGILGRKKAS